MQNKKINYNFYRKSKCCTYKEAVTINNHSRVNSLQDVWDKTNKENYSLHT